LTRLRLPAFGQDQITTPEIIHHLAAGVIREALQIDFAGPIRFQRDGNQFLLHRSPRNKLEPDLPSLGRLHELAPAEDISFGISVRHCLLFLVRLLHPAHPLFVEADPAVVFAEDCPEGAIGLSHESDII
jgi:hypothetical protein